jgi:hypothetical protein
MPSLDLQRRKIQAKIADAEQRRTDLQRKPRGPMRTAREAAIDFEILTYRQELRKLERGK